MTSKHIPKRLRRLRRPPLTNQQILAWADNHHDRTGTWPTAESGHVHEDLNEKWSRIDNALRLGLRGLDAGSSLARLLDQERDVRNRKALPPLTEEIILAWAKAHKERTAHWPTENSGPIPDTNGEVWGNVNAALAQGIRGLPGGETLPQLLVRRLGARNWASAPDLTVKQILAWADAHHRRTGGWPKAKSGPVAAAEGETWIGIDDALRVGLRGLSGGSSLARLLAEHRGVRNIHRLPNLTIPQILAWADDHHERTGRWPGVNAGPIAAAPGETWTAVGVALSNGRRGLPGGHSLRQLLLNYGRGG